MHTTRVALVIVLAACTRAAPQGAKTEPDASLSTAPAVSLAPTASIASAVALPANVIPVPLVRQETDFSCGDVAALALLRYWKWDAFAGLHEADLYSPLHTTSKAGTDPRPIEAYFDAQGLSATFASTAGGDGGPVDVADLEAAVDRREPPIVDLQAWRASAPDASTSADWWKDVDDGHYVVLVGYDAARFYFMDPSTRDHYTYIPRAELPSRWHDVLGPDNRRVEHMTIFVHGSGKPHPAAGQLPAAVTAIE